MEYAQRGIGHKTDNRKELRPTWRPVFQQKDCDPTRKAQPDFAHLVIDYVPAKFLVESKSLKLYLGSFRNYGAFHEDCTVAIGRRLFALLKPKWLRIGGYWYPRGGIPIDVFWQGGRLPKDVWVPDQGVAPYRGRG